MAQKTLPLSLPGVSPVRVRQKWFTNHPVLRMVLWLGGSLGGFVGFAVVACLLLGRIVPTAEIAFDSDRDGNWAIYLMDIRWGITIPLIHEYDHALNYPVWSLDSQQLAYVAMQQTQTLASSSVYIIESDGKNERLLTDIFVTANIMLAWSPDGTQLAVAGLTENLGQGIFVLNTDGTGRRQVQLQHSGLAFAPTWSPDGTHIAFSWSPTANAEIWVISAQETSEIVQAERITSDPMLDTMPAWSPDGEWIAFESGRSGNSEIYLMRPDGSDLHAITSHPARDTMPAWSPDGKQIVFVSWRDGNSELYLMDADGSNLQRLTYHEAFDSHPSWRP